MVRFNDGNNVFLDIDGTICDFTDSFYKMCLKTYPKRDWSNFKSRKDYKLHDNKDSPLTKKEQQRIFSKLEWEKMEKTTWCDQLLKSIDCDKVTLITARDTSVTEVTQEWVDKNVAPILKVEDIIYTGKGASGPKEKYKYLKNAFMFIDDYLPTILEVTRQPELEDIKLILVNQYWNKQDKLPLSITRYFGGSLYLSL